MSQKTQPRLSITQVLNSLIAQVAYARSHLIIAKHLRAADPVLLKTGRTFFGMTLDAHLSAAQMYASKLHDKTKGVVSVEYLLKEVARSAGLAKHGSPSNVRDAIDGARISISALKATVSKIEARRNQFLAHIDAVTIIDPTHLDTNYALTIDELDDLLIETGNIINDFAQLFENTFSTLQLLDSEDLSNVFTLLKEAKCAQAESYEREFNEPWPFDRPR